MGLDLADFILAIEDKFKIEIWDDTRSLYSIEDIIDSIERKTAQAPHSKEEADRLNHENFDKVKYFLAQELDLSLSQLTLETETASLFKTYRQRIRVWNEMNDDFSHHFPELAGRFLAGCYSGLYIILGSILFLYTMVIFVDKAGQVDNPAFYCLIPGMVSCIFIILYQLGIRLGAPLFFRIPKECQTLGGLARCAFRSEISLDAEGKIWSRQEIAEFVLETISDISGIPVEKISPEQSIVEVLDA